MNSIFKSKLLAASNAKGLKELGKVQDLWSGYGTIKRYQLIDGDFPTVIVKQVSPPQGRDHPRGWNSNVSHLRKLKSYRVESEWYLNWSQQCGTCCYVPQCYALETNGSEFHIALEDLDAVGFPLRKTTVGLKEMRLCLKWLAHFHATFIGQSPSDLWEIGTYWHLATRPEELHALKDKSLKSAAAAIDKKLNNCNFQTLVHGDAKLANFCFSPNGDRVAAVDFQYVGGGCGMKDVAYFIGSCLQEEDCEKYEEELLTYYFDVLGNVIRSKRNDLDSKEVLQEWRELFPVAWADFHRFLKGWSPGHWKINSYSEKITKEVVLMLSK